MQHGLGGIDCHILISPFSQGLHFPLLLCRNRSKAGSDQLLDYIVILRLISVSRYCTYHVHINAVLLTAVLRRDSHSLPHAAIDCTAARICVGRRNNFKDGFGVNEQQ
jgi:hypothetical protein